MLRPSQGNVVAALPSKPFRRGVAALATPAKRGVDAALVVHEACGYQDADILSATLSHRGSLNAHSLGIVPAV